MEYERYRIISCIVYKDIYASNMISLGILYVSQVYQGIIIALLASFWNMLVFTFCWILRLLLFSIYVCDITGNISIG
jgi:hypothetical protein